MIEKIIDLAEQFTPIALIGAGGVGKTSIALTVLHHDRIKRRFGDARRFIRCDQFPPSRAHLLSRLSKVIGAGIENPEDLASLRPFLSSKEMFIVLDNAESILDPEGMDVQKIYAVVEELSRLDNICLCITSRITAIPSCCETLDVPTLSLDAARDVFHRIYKNGERSDLVDGILGQLDFHPLSITLLATVGHQKKWDMDRLRGEWERQRTDVLQVMHDKSFAATIELSLASPMFQELGPDARALLEVIAFFPQGVDENNLSWLFPTISDRVNIFDKFCSLSLTYRSNSFITMLAPLRDHFCPKDPKLSPLLCMVKEQYFARMSVKINPNDPRYEDGRWIASEDVNVEHLLDVFTIDANSDDVWDACANFMTHLVWHKKRLSILSSKIEGLLDGHRFKPKCLFELSRLYHSVGDNAERRRLLTQTLKLWRERGNDLAVARTLRHLSKTNRQMGLPKEGIRLVQEASQILERLRDTVGQAQCLIDLASLLHSDNQLDAAEEAASRAIGLLPERGQEFRVCEHRRLLGLICQSKGETEKAVHHFEVARRIASPFNWHDQLFLVHCSLAQLFLKEGRFDDAQVHVERAKLYTSNRTYYLGRAMEVQAELWHKQHRLKQARSEASGAIDVFEKLGAVQNLEACKKLLRAIEWELNRPVVLDRVTMVSSFRMILFVTLIEAACSELVNESELWHRPIRHQLLLRMNFPHPPAFLPKNILSHTCSKLTSCICTFSH